MATVRVIHLPAHNRSVRLGEYVRIVRRVKESAPGTSFPESFNGWGPARREEILRQFMDGVHDRINEHLPHYGVGRKWSPDWFREMQKAAWKLNGRFVIRRFDLPRSLLSRFHHRITED